jgi:hypothetical protein
LKITDTRKITKTAKAMEALVHSTIFATPLEVELTVAPLDEETNVAVLERVNAVALKCALAFAGLFADTITVVVYGTSSVVMLVLPSEAVVVMMSCVILVKTDMYSLIAEA